jgi:hypothetical protein
MVLRLLIIANVIVISSIGIMAFAFVGRPANVVIAAGAWLFSGVLLGCLPYTDPYRGEGRPQGEHRRR